MYYLGLDTETANSYEDENGLNLMDSLVYDFGYEIFTKKGKTKVARSFVIAEIFLDKSLMTSAYYAEKVPNYWKDIKKGKRKLVKFETAWRIFKQDLKKYDIKAVFAHNARFDLNALNKTARYLTGSKKRFFFPKRIEIWDTLKMARNTIGRTEEYTTFCIEHDFLTKHRVPQNRLTAEILWRFISGDIDFEESHTGLEDVQIEKEIFLFCLKLDAKVEKNLF